MKRYFVIFYRFVLPPGPVKDGWGLINIYTQGETSAPYVNMASAITAITEQLEQKPDSRGAKVIITGVNELSESDNGDWMKGHEKFFT